MALKRIVVTGGSGRVGRFVLDELAGHFDVTNADLAPATAGANSAPPIGVDYVATDVLDLDAVRRATKGADAVIHLAAIDYDWKAAPDKYIRVNTMGTWNVLQAASENNLQKVVLCSSVSACGLSEMRPDWQPQTLQVDETHELRPVQAYSLSKQIMENMGLAMARGTSMDVLCIRPLAVVLPDALEEYTSFIDDPQLHWLYYYIEAQDLARAFRAALDVKDLKFGTFFIGAEDTSHPEPTLDWYRKRFGALPEIYNPRVYQTNPRASIFSSSKARDLLGWEPSTDFMKMRAQAGI